ncbi:MAG: arginyl-tRNA synthetase, partial [Candidatus Azotimanducaceae bacterium]
AVIRTAIEEVLKDLQIEGVDFVVEHPSELSHGDYTCNVAMAAAQKLSKNPREVAEEITLKLEGQIEYVEKISVAGPGFINIHLSRDFFTTEISRANELGEDWGKNTLFEGKTVVVEYTDPNPFKEFHVGHLFTNSVGESIARLFMVSSADTKRVNYQGDVGMHVACVLWGMEKLGYAGTYDFTAQELGKAYAHGATAYKDDETAQVEIRYINKAVYERTDPVTNALYDKGRQISLDYFESVYAVLDTNFDHYFFESEAGPRGKELVAAHADIFPESDGAHVFKGEDHGLHTRVFLNSEGLPTYEAKELALAKMKEETVGAYDLSIISTSNEITEYFKVLKKAMSFVYPELEKKTEHIGHGTVRLSSGKMSSRTGEIIRALDFIDEIAAAVEQKMTDAGTVDVDRQLAQSIAVGAIKYATLKGNILQDTVFDKDQALSFEGASGPYLQYTHARICSLLTKAEKVGVKPSITHAPDIPYEVERVLYRFPEVIEEAVTAREPHKVVTYLTELAGLFNTFYAHEKIADPADEFAPYKAAVAEAVGQTLKNGLWVLGIKAPERM